MPGRWGIFPSREALVERTSGRTRTRAAPRLRAAETRAVPARSIFPGGAGVRAIRALLRSSTRPSFYGAVSGLLRPPFGRAGRGPRDREREALRPRVVCMLWRNSKAAATVAPA